VWITPQPVIRSLEELAAPVATGCPVSDVRDTLDQT
jgi:hypothetical protein